MWILVNLRTSVQMGGQPRIMEKTFEKTELAVQLQSIVLLVPS